MSVVASLDARWGRAYFAAQSLAGISWWVSVAVSPAMRMLTLGELPVGLTAVFDIPLFVAASALAACGIRLTACIATGWTVLVAAAMAVYATATSMAGWGALLMIGAGACSVGALLLVRMGRLPSEWLIIGVFAPREAAPARARTHLLRTGGQIVVFWGACLVVIPIVIVFVEGRWGLRLHVPLAVPVVGAIALLAATSLGLWSAVTMAGRGDGTPLPSSTARALVVSGPYRYVRNPMAVAGIAQGVAIGMLCGSWLVVVYALCGSLVWNHLIRPWEEKDLLARFGAPYQAYCERVSCWIPRRPRRPASGSTREPLVY